VTPAEFDACFRAQFSRLAALGTILTGSREVGADLAQEALLRALRDWSRVSALESPAGWLRRVVTHLAIDSARHQLVEERHRRALVADVAVDGEPAPDRELWAAVSALPPRQRAAVALYYVYDRSVDEVADAMGVSTGSVKTTLHQARTALRTRLAEEER
jgi:RNA polymerase sigma-70 factor (ECF subfamily)